MYPDVIFIGMSLYDICIAVGIILAMVLADHLAYKKGFSLALQKVLLFATVGGVILGFLGAVLFQGFYRWIETGEFSLQSGMTFYGGLIFGAGGFLACWFGLSIPFGVKEEARKRFFEMANVAACVIPLAHAFGRVGCFFAGCCHGKQTSSWIGVTMYQWESGEYAKCVPVQLFEAAFLLALSGVLFYLFMKKKTGFPLLSVYLIAYGIWRFCIEFARGDDRGQSPVPFLTPSQFIAVILIAVGVGYGLVCILNKRNENKKSVEVQKDGKSGGNAGV